VSLWKKREGPPSVARPHGAPRLTPVAAEAAGAYQSLYKYLRDRYANRVVLTFGEIEDLLGFALPDPARAQREWWDGSSDPTTPRSAQSASWMLASRTATVNLVAESVVFDRETAVIRQPAGR
jgi:hypothetical protein